MPTPSFYLRSSSAARALAQPAQQEYESLNVVQMSGLSEHVMYEVTQPVTVNASESAIIPILDNMIPGERILQYDPKHKEVNATKCIHFTNSTDQVFANGRVCVYEDGHFMGHAHAARRQPACALRRGYDVVD